MHRVLRPDGAALILLPDRRQTFDAGRPPTPLDTLVREALRGASRSPSADIDEFLRYADPEAFRGPPTPPPIPTHVPESTSGIANARSTCIAGTRRSSSKCSRTCYVELGHTWEFLDGVIAEDEGPNGFEYGYVLRKATTRVGRRYRRCRASTQCGPRG